MDPLARINGAKYSWNSVICRVGTLRAVGLVSADFDDKITQALVYASRRDGTPLGMTAGKYEPGPAVLKFLLEAWTGGTAAFPLGIEEVFHDGLGSSGRMLVPVFLQWFEEATGQPTSVVLASCRLVGRKIGTAEGVEASVMEATLQPLEVKINGKSLASIARVAP